MMSIKTMLMPLVTRHLLSRERLLKQRAKAERLRVAAGRRHRVLYFHQADDPYSALAAAALPRLLARYDIDLVPHLVGAPADAAAPERDKLVAYSRKDAALLARHWSLAFTDSGVQPSPQAVQHANAELLAAIEAGRFTQWAAPLGAALWAGAAQATGKPGATAEPTLPSPALQPAAPAAVQAHLTQSQALRQRLGHYLGATFHYAGEWYWGIDRLHHLEQRLQALGAQREPLSGPMFPPNVDLALQAPLAQPPVIDFFISLRSPYSAIVAPRVFELGRLTGAPVKLRYVLPMVMRGLPVPREKRMYISQDAAREAFVRGIPFGCLNDPVGRPTERGLAVIPFAERAGKAQDYLLSFMRGVWSEGIDAGSERGLRRIVERAGLPWADAQTALQDEHWRATAESNRAELFSLGLWGVPSFRVRDTAVWGQDRLWAIEEELLKNTR